MSGMRKVGTVAVDEVLIGDTLYQRQVDIVANFASPNGFLNYGESVWFVENGDSWDWAGDFRQEWLEKEWQALTNPTPECWTDEERKDALCEQMASDDYETSVYG